MANMERKIEVLEKYLALQEKQAENRKTELALAVQEAEAKNLEERNRKEVNRLLKKLGKSKVVVIGTAAVVTGLCCLIFRQYGLGGLFILVVSMSALKDKKKKSDRKIGAFQIAILSGALFFFF